MVDSVKNYGIAGVDSTVELGKAGQKIVSSASDVSLKNPNDSLSKAKVQSTDYYRNCRLQQWY